MGRISKLENGAWLLDIRIDGKRVRKRVYTDEGSARILLRELEKRKKQKEFAQMRKILLDGRYRR